MGNSDGKHTKASSVSPSWRVVASFLLVTKEATWALPRQVSLFFFFSFLVVSILSSLEKRIASYDFDLVSLQKKKKKNLKLLC